MKRIAIALAAFAALAGAPLAGDLIEQVKIYAPINAIAIPCALQAIDQKANFAMLAGAQSDPDAAKLLARLHRETQAAYRAARDAGNKAAFCSKFLSDNSQYAK
jgi:hypothetical protein